MNVVSSAARIASLAGGVASLSNLFPNVQVPGGASTNGWRASLRPASYGGVPFGVLGAQLKVGRRNATHEYPFRDRVWVEDMGRAARRIFISGFLAENAAYGGGRSVIVQRDRLIAVCESPNAKTLVHPTLGTLNVSLLDCSMEERWDRGRVFEITFSFIESGEKEFPRPSTNTQGAVLSACDAADAAVGGDFSASVAGTLTKGASVVSMAVDTAFAWSGVARGLVADATNLMSMSGVLSGSYGRFFGGRLRQLGSLQRSLTTATTVSQLLARGTVARANVTAIASKFVATASGLSL